MSASLNEVNLIGNLAKEPEIRSTQAGKKIANITVATSESWKDAAGEKKERVEYHRVVIFNENLASVAERFLKKGDKAFFRGALTTRKWQDSSGNDRYSTEVVLQGYSCQLILLGSPKRDGAAGKTATAGDLLDDDLPFES
jgi:single-strand DNA-binding protein